MKDPSVNPDNRATPGTTSVTLLTRLKRRDADAWRRFVRLYGPLVHAWCRRKGLQSSDAADVVQEVFRSIAQNVGEFEQRDGGTFRGWMWTITLNKLRDHFRRAQRSPNALGGADGHEQMQRVPFENAAPPEQAGDDGGLMRRALEMLRVDFEERTWRAFWSVTVDDRAPADVARELGITTNAVYVAKSRVLSRLRGELIDLGL